MMFPSPLPIADVRSSQVSWVVVFSMPNPGSEIRIISPGRIDMPAINERRSVQNAPGTCRCIGTSVASTHDSYSIVAPCPKEFTNAPTERTEVIGCATTGAAFALLEI